MQLSGEKKLPGDFNALQQHWLLHGALDPSAVHLMKKLEALNS